MNRNYSIIIVFFLASCTKNIDVNKIPLPKIITPTEMYPTTTPILPTFTNTPTKTITLTPDQRYYDTMGYSFIPPSGWISENYQYPKAGRGWKYTQNGSLLCDIFFNIKFDVINSPQEEAQKKIAYHSSLAFLEFQYEKPFPTEYFPNGYTFSFRVFGYQDEFYQKDFIFLKDQKAIWPIISCSNERYPESLLIESMKTLRLET